MANPTSITNTMAIVGASVAESSVELDPDRDYTITHLGVRVADGATDSGKIYLATHRSGESAPSVAANLTTQDNKIVLTSSRSVVVGPGVKALYFISNATTPAMSVVPGPPYLGKY